MLIGALDTLEFLLGVVESRSAMRPGESSEISHPTTIGPENKTVNDTNPVDAPPILNAQSASESDIGSPLGGSVSDRQGHSTSPTLTVLKLNYSQRSSQETAATSAGRGSTSTLCMPVSELEKRLKTDRTLDIFTMKPKVRLILD